MSRYFFNILARGRTIRDPEGNNLAGDKQAKAHAKMAARDMMQNRDRYKPDIENWKFVITDKAGRQIGIVSFSSTPRIRTPRRSN